MKGFKNISIACGGLLFSGIGTEKADKLRIVLL